MVLHKVDHLVKPSMSKWNFVPALAKTLSVRSVRIDMKLTRDLILTKSRRHIERIAYSNGVVFSGMPQKRGRRVFFDGVFSAVFFAKCIYLCFIGDIIAEKIMSCSCVSFKIKAYNTVAKSGSVGAR